VRPDARGLVGRALKSSAAAVDRVRAPQPGVVVLIYHRVGAGSGLELDLPTAVFDAQMRELAASGRVATLDDALDRLADSAATGDDPVVVTFDDGPADFVDTALPILTAHGVPERLDRAHGVSQVAVHHPGVHDVHRLSAALAIGPRDRGLALR